MYRNKQATEKLTTKVAWAHFPDAGDISGLGEFAAVETKASITLYPTIEEAQASGFPVVDLSVENATERAEACVRRTKLIAQYVAAHG